jgi:transcriptional regulator with XRE-family HTH domain
MTDVCGLAAPTEQVTAEELRLFRHRMGLSQAALASLLGISKRGVEQWEGSQRQAPLYLRLALERLAISRAAATGETRVLRMPEIDDAQAIADIYHRLALAT